MMSSLTPYEPPLYDEDDDHEELGRPLRIVAKLKNNRLIRAREAMGYKSIKAAARAIHMSYSTLARFEALTEDPWSHHTNDWKAIAWKIARAYVYHPEELWPEAVRRVKVHAALLEVGAAPPHALLPEAEIEDVEARDKIAGVLRSVLTPREHDVLARRFGLNGRPEEYLSTVSGTVGVSRERIRQIEMMALKKLRASSQTNTIKAILGEGLEVCPGCRQHVQHLQEHHPFESGDSTVCDAVLRAQRAASRRNR